VYYVYGFFLLVFLILLAVVLNTTIVSTYFLLNAENYKWQWASFSSAASTAVYVYAYAVYYFFFKTHMNGLFQTLFYFGYSAMAALYLAIMCGSIGYLGASAFCKRIYSTLKVE
jgi:transmembrane 9 superfamily protein 3